MGLFLYVLRILICPGCLVQFNHVHHILPAYLILVPPTSFKKDEFLSFWFLTGYSNISLVYVHEYTRHTHTQLALFTMSLFLRMGLIGPSVNHYKYHTLLIERFFFPFPLRIREKQTLIITKCMDVVPSFVQHDAHALVSMAISAF